jgi:hypothetical protein
MTMDNARRKYSYDNTKLLSEAIRTRIFVFILQVLKLRSSSVSYKTFIKHNSFIYRERELFISFAVACCSYGTDFTGK